MPWPSLGYQQAALAGAVVLGLIVAAVGVGVMTESGGLVGGLVATLAGFALAAMAVYAGWTTRWLDRTSNAPLSVEVVGGIAIGFVVTLGLLVYGSLWLLYYGGYAVLFLFDW